MLNTQSLSFSYPNGRKFSFPDISCKAGDSLLILGESGTGKTTLLHLLAGFLSADSGKILLGDTDICSLTSAELDKFRGQHIGMVFQKPHFIRSLTVSENLQLAQFFSGKASKNKLDSIVQTLDRLQLASRMKDYPWQMSVGEQQRIAIARAVLNKPRVILADEPSSALDDQNCERVMDLLEEQSRYAQASLIIVTHDMRLKDRYKRKIEL